MEPYAFICHASEDKLTAEKLATDLQAAGIKTFLDKWEIRSGDSLRQKIDEGLGQCTHFLALLSPVALKKAWVNAELDAGFVRKINAQATLIPVRLGLRSKDLPSLLSGLLSPSLDDYDGGIKGLIEDIHGVSKKPPLGSRSSMYSSGWAKQAALSVAAARVAEILLTRSQRGRHQDPSIPVGDLQALTGYTDDQLIDAVDELEKRGLVEPARTNGRSKFGYHAVRATQYLFESLDSSVMGWRPEDDARTVAATLVNEGNRSMSADDLAKRLGWTPRRLNPALAYLGGHGFAELCENMDREYVAPSITMNSSTHRFARGRG